MPYALLFYPGSIARCGEFLEFQIGDSHFIAKLQLYQIVIRREQPNVGTAVKFNISDFTKKSLGGEPHPVFHHFRNTPSRPVAVESKIEPELHIIGPLKVQNELMASFLERETGFTCCASEDLDLCSIASQDNGQIHLILWDSTTPNLDNLWPQLSAGYNPDLAQCFLALFNVVPGNRIEIEAAKRGVRGIFYKDTPLEILVKGARAILNRKFWFSRDTMAKLLMEARNTAWISKEIDASIFTCREKEVLELIACGATNQQIAEKLCISPHTVRTHTCNIYLKIDVTNRLQAALWAVKNL